MTSPFKHITIVGLGLIGGSLAMAIKSRFPEVQLHAVDAHGETLQFALKNKFADTVSLTLPEQFEDDHLILLACHLKASLEVLENIAPQISGKQSIVISDIGSCKRRICDLGAKLLPEQFIGGHPMAGRETSGIQNATSLMFADKRYILCPTARTPGDSLEKLETIVKGTGGIIKHLGPETHDRIMAYVSHFPQLYATLLSGVLKENKPTQLMQYQGAGLDDQMRLAGSSYAMWKDIYEENADNVALVMQQFITRMQTAQGVLNQLAQEETSNSQPKDINTNALAELFDNANEMYHTWLEFKQNPIKLN